MVLPVHPVEYRKGSGFFGLRGMNGCYAGLLCDRGWKIDQMACHLVMPAQAGILLLDRGLQLLESFV